MRENVLFEEEKTYFPDLQSEAERLMTLEKIKEKQLKIERKIIDNNMNEDQLVRDQRATDRSLRKECYDLSVEYRKLAFRERPRDRKKFIMKCVIENCRGFLSDKYECGLCLSTICKDCHRVLPKEGAADAGVDESHTCNPDDVATIKELQQNTKPCPKCHIRIYKIDGCDQMYCTQCHTAFSWRTGRIETGVIHNPHYYEFMRNRGTLPRNPGDVPCGGFPEWSVISRLVTRTHIFWTIIAGAHRSWAHCQWALIPRYTVNNNQDNRDLRIKYMIGDFLEEEFKKKIQQREKARQRRNDIRQVLEMYMAVLSDLFQAFVQDRGVDILVGALVELRRHVNTTMDSVSKRYTNCAVPRISENYDMI
jgi:hypothetical protein